MAAEAEHIAGARTTISKMVATLDRKGTGVGEVS
jgi:hypothetical protein